MMMRLLLLVPLLVACSGEGGQFRPIKVGDAAPAYAADRLTGEPLELASLRGHAVLLNIWATWCAPCRAEMPALETLHERYHDRGLRVVGVSVDAPGSEQPIRRFMEEYGLTFTVLFDPSDRVSRTFRAAGVPETFLIDAEGRIAHRWIGRFEPLSPDAVTRVEAELPGGNP